MPTFAPGYVAPYGYGPYFPSKRRKQKLLGQTFDLKTVPKKQPPTGFIAWPVNIKIDLRIHKKYFKGRTRTLYYVSDVSNPSASFYTSYYFLHKYYLTYSVSANRVTVPVFAVVSNPTVPYDQLTTRKFDVLGRTRRRMWEAQGLTEEQIKAKEEEIKNKPYIPDPNADWDKPECVLYRDLNDVKKDFGPEEK